MLAHLHQVLELRPHDVGAADDPAQRALVHHRPQRGRLRPGQDLLAGDPGLGLAEDLVFGWVVAQPDDRASVVRGLQQAGDELELVLPDDRGRGLEAEVRLDPVRQDVRVPLPPARRARLAGQPHQRLALLARADLVQGQQVRDVALLERDPAVLHAADLGMRAADHDRGALGRDARFLPQPAEVTAEHEALHCRPR